MSLGSINRQLLKEEMLQQVQQGTAVQQKAVAAVAQQDEIREAPPPTSRTVAPTSAVWATPQLAPSSYASPTPAQDALQDLQQLPPPPPSIQRFHAALQQMKAAPPPPPPGLSSMGEAAFLTMSSQIHAEGNAIVTKSLQLGQTQENIALQKLEQINDLCNDLSSLENQIQQLINNMNAEKSASGKASVSYHKYTKMVSVIRSLLRNGDINVTYETRDGGVERTHFSYMGPTQLFAYLLHPSGGSMFLNMSIAGGHVPPSLASSIQKVFVLGRGSKCGLNLWNSILSKLNIFEAAASEDYNLYMQMRGAEWYRFVIPQGYTATFMKEFASFKIITNLHGTKEVVCPNSKINTPGGANRFTAFCQQQNIQAPQPLANHTLVSNGVTNSIPHMQEAIYQVGKELCQLLGWPPGKIDMNDIQQALQIAKQLQKILAKILEVLNEKGNGLAVFTAFQNAIASAQQMNQKMVAESEQRSTNFNETQMDQMQDYITVITQTLAEMNSLTDQIAQENKQLQQLSDANYGAMALGGLSLLCTIFGAAASWFTGGASLALATGAAAIIGTASGVAGGLLGGSVMVAQGVIEVEQAEAMQDLGKVQKSYAADQRYIQEKQAASNLITQMTSTTTQALIDITQRQVAIEKDVMAMYTSASQAVSAAAHA